MSEIAIEKLKGHDNSCEGFETIAYVELPNWLAYKLTGVKKAIRMDNYFAVVKETEKSYQIVYERNTSLSWNFIRFTWFINYVSKSIVKSVRTDVEQYEKELADKYFESEAKKKK